MYILFSCITVFLGFFLLIHLESFTRHSVMFFIFSFSLHSFDFFFLSFYLFVRILSLFNTEDSDT